MSDKPLRVCIVGCGDLGRTHARCWSNIPEAQIVTVVDIQEERALKLAGELNLDNFYLDYREAISRQDVNVVSVCIPTNLHPAVTIYAAEHGKHVLSEKPIALDLPQADAMIAATQHHAVQFSVGLMRYHSPVLAELKHWLDRACLDQPVIYWASDIREVRPKREMHDANANGGPVIDMAVHLFATWQYLFAAPVQEVYAHGFTFAQHRPELGHIHQKAVDTATISVRYQSGDVGNFLVSWGVPPGVVPPAMPEVILTASGVVHAKFNANHQQASVQCEGGNWEIIATCEENMYQREIQDFAQSILLSKPPIVSGIHGRSVLQVSLAALESIQSGRPVYVGDQAADIINSPK